MKQQILSLQTYLQSQKEELSSTYRQQLEKLTEENSQSLIQLEEEFSSAYQQQLDKWKEENNQSLIHLQEERETTSKKNDQISGLELHITKLKAKRCSYDIFKDESISLVVILRYIQQEFNLKLDDL